jgi:integrase
MTPQRPPYDKKEVSIATREDSPRQAVLRWARREPYTSAIAFVYDIARSEGWNGASIVLFLRSLKIPTARAFLKGLVFVHAYCVDKGISGQQFVNQHNPEAFVADFLHWPELRKNPLHIQRVARAAMCKIWHTFLARPDLAKNQVIRSILLPAEAQIKPQARYRSIFDINILLNYYRQAPSNSDLCLRRLIAKAIVLLRIFTACRTAEVVNILWEKVQINPSKGVAYLPTRPKDKGSRQQSLIIHALSDVQERICPFRTLLDLKIKQNDPLLTSISPFRTAPGRFLSSSAQAAKLIMEDMQAAGVPSEFKPHSIRAAVISKAFALNLSRDQISLLSGHSLNTNTIMQHYYREIDNWPGFRIANGFLSPERTAGQQHRNNHGPN